MKTIFSLAILATLALTSCKKDYTCTCTTTVHRPAFVYAGMEVQEESTTTMPSSSTTIKDKKDEAKTKCESSNGTTSVPSSWAQYGAKPTTTTVACSTN